MTAQIDKHSILHLLLDGNPPERFRRLPQILDLARILAENIQITCAMNSIPLETYCRYPHGRRLIRTFVSLTRSVKLGIPYIPPPPATDDDLPADLHPVEYLFIMERRENKLTQI